MASTMRRFGELDAGKDEPGTNIPDTFTFSVDMPRSLQGFSHVHEEEMRSLTTPQDQGKKRKREDDWEDNLRRLKRRWELPDGTILQQRELLEDSLQALLRRPQQFMEFFEDMQTHKRELERFHILCDDVNREFKELEQRQALFDDTERQLKESRQSQGLPEDEQRQQQLLQQISTLLEDMQGRVQRLRQREGLLRDMQRQIQQRHGVIRATMQNIFAPLQEHSDLASGPTALGQATILEGC